MVSIADILANRKSTSDFMEIEAAKKRQKIADELAVKKMEKEVNAEALPFGGTGFDAQVGNIAYEKFLSEGMTPMQAKQAAADAVLKSKVDYTMVKDPYTGVETPVAKPRMPVFEAQTLSSSPALQNSTGYAPEVITEDLAANSDIATDPMLASQQARAIREKELAAQGIAPNPYANNTNILNMPAAQGAAMDRPKSSVFVDPRALNNPEVQKELAKEAGKQLIKANDPEFLLKARELGLDEEKARLQMETTKLAANEIYSVLDNLLDEKGNLREGVEEIVGGTLGMRGNQSSILPLTKNQRKYQPYINQIRGQSFLKAFETLKGGGQITQIEGEKATDAIARLAQYQDPEDFAKSLRDIKEYALKIKKIVSDKKSENVDVQSLIDKYAD